MSNAKTIYMNQLKSNPYSLIALALPAMASALLNNAYRMIDQYSVKWLGTASQAAISSSTFILIAAYSIFLIISSGSGPLFARATGAKNEEDKRKIVGQSTIATIITSCCFCFLLIFCNGWLTNLIGLEGKAASEMETYLTWLGYGGFFLAFGPLIDAIYIAHGNTRFPMLLQFWATILNGILNWLLIYELEMGIAGAALASGLSRAIVSIFGIYYLFSDFPPAFSVDKYMKRIISVGVPMSAGVASYAIVYWVILKTCISPMGSEVYAGLGIGFSVLEGVSWPLYSGIMVAVSSLIGRQLGAKDIQGAKRTIWLALPISSGVGFILGIVFYLFAPVICSKFTMDSNTLQQAIIYGQILAFSQIFVAWEALFEGVLAGAGDTKTILIVSLPLNILRIPLSYYFAFGLGWQAAGIWWAINISTYLKTGVKGYYVWKGDWKFIDP
jgi:MATE family multidrug resistance protein